MADAAPGRSQASPHPLGGSDAVLRGRGADTFDVAIVGYGPVGAVAAGLLGQAGFSVHVCDRLTGVCEIPRAIALDHEILRVCQQLGVVDEVLRHCEPFTDSEYFGVDGQLIRRMTMVAPPYPQGYTPSVVFTQPPVERVLRARVAALPNVTVAEGVECTALSQDAEGVTLTVAGAPVRARWAIAADGGASSLRGALGIGLADLDFDEPWLVVDVMVNERGLAKLPKTSVQYCEPARPCTLVIGPGNHRRWEISLRPGEDPKQAATPEGTWALLSRWLSPEDGTLWRQSSYRFHALVAECWRAGRVFLAGDAAHMQPPFLGQGMCQGVRDAANLAWKLGAVLRGDAAGAAAQRLLDSYGIERQAHVRALTTRLKEIGAVICERDVAQARARDARLLADCGGVIRDTPRQDVLPALSAGLITATPGAGTLFPQPRLAGGELMDRRFGCGWRLVVDGALPADAAPGLVLVDLGREPEAEGVVAAWMKRHGAHAAIVRPDHYTFGSAADVAGLAALLAQWLAR
ncbi:MAG: bifunctional 3-(3-hydroxy-phenyl)propionate/3-hydroxycinnamic acid hydroxylase [Burkholderiales bacterium]|nr:bifunctional 3-(3-hydroxy-phenyl)propionate/3-hydroxycinnamic acid hydroxylase [Burkholderiales bacterium]